MKKNDLFNVESAIVNVFTDMVKKEDPKTIEETATLIMNAVTEICTRKALPYHKWFDAIEDLKNQMKAAQETVEKLSKKLNSFDAMIESAEDEDIKEELMTSLASIESRYEEAENNLDSIKGMMEAKEKEFDNIGKEIHVVNTPIQNVANESQQKIIAKETRVKPNGYDHDATVTNAKITLVSEATNDGCMVVCDQNKKGFKCYFDPKMDKFLYSVSRDKGSKYFDTTFATVKKYVDFSGKHFIVGIFAEDKKEIVEK